MIGHRNRPWTAKRCGQVSAGVFGLCTILGCTTVRRDYSQPPPAVPSTLVSVQGRWIDVEEAVAAAAAEVEMAVATNDRWQSAWRFTLRTNPGQSGELLITGTPEGGPALAEARIGRFRDAVAEEALLEALADALDRYSEIPRLPGAR
jgi:hypothetical protein